MRHCLRLLSMGKFVPKYIVGAQAKCHPTVRGCGLSNLDVVHSIYTAIPASKTSIEADDFTVIDQIGR